LLDIVWCDMIWYDMIWYDIIWFDIVFIYCSWVSTRWQRSVNLYKNRRERQLYRKGEAIHKTIRNTEYTKWKTNMKTKLKKHKSVIIK
jgi:hypothetical protein